MIIHTLYFIYLKTIKSVLDLLLFSSFFSPFRGSIRTIKLSSLVFSNVLYLFKCSISEHILVEPGFPMLQICLFVSTTHNIVVTMLCIRSTFKRRQRFSP